ncbi:hypothetical protein [Mesorhizobium shangrilense]|uniref:Uncharacterized protein n=1 Tax=Mesorhizobium shangrilense TaxID=460060 RepID=A0ABV2DPZ7_9HYPH
MQNNAAELLAALGDCIEAIKLHLATMDDAQLEKLLDPMPKKSAPGSAEMVMLVMLYRELESRNHGNVLPFPVGKA